ncbi:MAG: FAD-dependent oxidoreductase [Oscillospiraceae bacterium]|nr:FAD-dependent oxidoreductase [Oscillospiraceae bacterium]
MIRTEKADVAVVGAGPAGLAAAAEAKNNGAPRVVVLERNPSWGGVLNQCIHDGFGLYRYGQELSGPEFAELAALEAENSGAELRFCSTVTNISKNRELTVVSPQGLYKIQAGAVVLASGCRERTRGNLMIPGDRPAGIFTAGTAQELINLRGLKIGTRAIILGSGDIGLIVARRLTLMGIKVEAICEAGDHPTGLTRNIVQCARDFGIPILTRTTVSNIIGKDRLSAVELSKTDDNMRPLEGSEKQLIPCDTLILSVGLIPERDLVSSFGETEPDGTLKGAEGIFLCGNCKKIEQLADMASLSGEAAGRLAAAFAAKKEAPSYQAFPPPKLPTGFPAENSVICTGCPRGCCVTLDKEGNASGNFCPRGRVFALEEAKDPKRYLTLSVASDLGKAVSLRSQKPIPARLLLAEAKRLSSEILPAKKAVLHGVCGLTAADAELTVTGISPFDYLE